MHSFVRNLITEWRRLKLPVAGETLVAGISGGADSVSLLLALNELKTTGKLDLRIVAAHFNHRLRDGESDADEAFVRELTSSRGIELAVGHAKDLSGGNLEQNARNARYAFLQKTADNLGAFAIATAHTINDQAETFLLNLIRGSGPDGLAGMKVARSFGEREKGRRGEGEIGREGDAAKLSDISGSHVSPSPFLPFSPSPPGPSQILLIRPLLNWAKRIDTESYCRELGVEYRYDTMNEDETFKRVRVRKILIPLLEDFNPKIVDTLANTARILQNETDLSVERSERPKVDKDSGRSEFLPLKDLKSLSQGQLYEILRGWLRSRRGNLRLLELKHIEAIERLIHSRKSGKTVELPGSGAVIRENGRLEFRNIKVEK